jgi:hypothetical protein
VVSATHADIIASESEYNPSDLNSIKSINNEAPVKKEKQTVRQERKWKRNVMKIGKSRRESMHELEQ